MPYFKPAGILISLVVTALLLCLTDLAIRSVSTEGAFAVRLPEHFSAYRLKKYVERVGAGRSALLVLGDSVLWGYGLPVEDTAVARLRERFPRTPIVNAAYEAGSPLNSDFLIRYLLSERLYPRAVLFDLNLLSFNQFGKTYDALNPALETLASPSVLEPFDQNRLRLARPVKARAEVWSRADDYLETHWALYGSRVDIHQALFGDADAATALHNHLDALVQASTLNQRDALEPSTPYAEMYDLTPLSPNNIAYAYTQHLLSILAANRIPTIAIITPANHILLHNYIDVPAYDANLRGLETLCHRYGAAVVNLDRRIPPNEFIDNTHLTKMGNGALAHAIAPDIARILDVL